MRVFIAEKPSLGRAIAAVLPGPQAARKTHIISGEANVVVWCAGHILEQYYPEDYNPTLKHWSLDTLLIVPDTWQLKVSARTRDLYKTIEKYAKQADLIVHAGDPDREGQLLVDEVLAQLGIVVPIQRILISDLNPPAVRKALADLKENSAYAGLGQAALGRSRADWLFGLNLTRLYTLQSQASGHQGVVSVGRVQTPVLGLVVHRDLEIADFQSKPFYTLEAHLVSRSKAFIGRWKPGDDANDHLDKAGRVVNRAFAESLSVELTGSPAHIVSVEKTHKHEAPPLPFSLPNLQKYAANHRGLSPKQTLDIAQSLYEEHQTLTYPRSDSQHLPTEHWSQAPEIRNSIGDSVGEHHELHTMSEGVNLLHRGRCWNDSKVTAHHAIIPTAKAVNLATLNSDQQWVYEAVAHRYLLQFCADREYDQTDIGIAIDKRAGTEQFTSRGQLETEAGWTVWRTQVDTQPENASDTEETHPVLPPLTEGALVECRSCELVEKTTSPPKRFTEASLLDAMTGISRYVEDPEIKRTLRETDGLGTPATQASILETLFTRGFLKKQGKQVHSTSVGKELINALPETVTLPDMTALWEQDLKRVETGDATLDDFLDTVKAEIKDLVADGIASGKLALGEATARQATQTASETPKHPCPGRYCEGQLRRIKGKIGFFWGCSRYRNGCRETRADSRGKPKLKQLT